MGRRSRQIGTADPNNVVDARINDHIDRSDDDTTDATSADDNNPAERIAGHAVFDPAGTGTGTTDSGPEPRKRGRKPGQKNRTTGKSETPSPVVETIQKMLFSIHLMGASITATPELVITPDQSKALAAAINDVASHFPSTIINPLYVSIAHLAMVLGGIYVPMVIVIRNKGKKQLPKPFAMPTVHRPSEVVVEKPAAPEAGKFAPSQFNAAPPVDNRID